MNFRDNLKGKNPTAQEMKAEMKYNYWPVCMYSWYAIMVISSLVWQFYGKQKRKEAQSYKYKEETQKVVQAHTEALAV